MSNGNPPRQRRGVRNLVALVLVLALAAFALAWRPPIGRLDAPPARTGFDAATLHRGAQLATLGNCVSCHTASGGQPFAGGRPVPTPFGTVYATNITPDAQTGIGTWSEDAFRRALREGVSRDGHLLYPAFPYNHFTHLRDGDIHALYAYVMTRDAVHAVAPANRLVFPLQFRPLLAGWNLLYLHPGPEPAPAGATPELQRGAYLVDALTHCAACHTPRDRLGGEDRNHPFAGGEAEGWHASALDAHAESPVPWNADALAAYLRSGLVADHAMTAGPMQDVVRSLSEADPADVQAIAATITAGMQPVTPERQAREKTARDKAQQPLAADGSAGARLYADNCASCHDRGRGLSSNSAMHLSLAVALYMPDARNLLHIVRQGIQPPVPGQPGRWMPPFEGTLTNEQLATLAAWLRAQVGQPAWPDLQRAVNDTEVPKP